METNSKRDIWDRSIETVFNWCKRAELEYVESLMESCQSEREKQRLIKIKKMIHQQVTQAQYGISMTFLAHRQGGSIAPFEDLMRPEALSAPMSAPLPLEPVAK